MPLKQHNLRIRIFRVTYLRSPVTIIMDRDRFRQRTINILTLPNPTIYPSKNVSDERERHPQIDPLYREEPSFTIVNVAYALVRVFHNSHLNL